MPSKTDDEWLKDHVMIQGDAKYGNAVRKKAMTELAKDKVPVKRTVWNTNQIKSEFPECEHATRKELTGRMFKIKAYNTGLFDNPQTDESIPAVWLFVETTDDKKMYSVMCTCTNVVKFFNEADRNDLIKQDVETTFTETPIGGGRTAVNLL